MPRSNQTLRAIIDCSPSGLVMADADGHIVLVNREIERMFGYEREELIGQPIELLVPDAVRDKHPELRTAFMAQPKVRAMGAGRDFYGRRRDGSSVPVEIGLTPLATSKGLSVLGAVVDLSERQRAERERRELEQQLREAQKLEALGRVAGSVAHDFNNALSVILGYAEIVRAAVADRPLVARDIGDIIRAAEGARELIERILSFSRPRRIELRPVDLVQLVRDELRRLRPALPANVELRDRLDQPMRAHANPSAVSSVLMNLAMNAAHAMPSGGVIEVALDPFYARDSFVRARPGLREGSYAKLSVRDTGVGMDNETSRRAFEPFFTTKPAGRGTGLGLPSVSATLRDHGGTVWLESEPGAGTIVNCLFRSVDQDEANRVAADAALPRGNGGRVLVVDDDPQLAELGERRISALGYSASGAGARARQSRSSA
jgi:PAS domain S-box-containing protein